MQEIRDILIIAKELIAKPRVIAPQGQRKLWKVVGPGGKVYYSPDKPGERKKQPGKPSPRPGYPETQPGKPSPKPSTRPGQPSQLRQPFQPKVHKVPKQPYQPKQPRQPRVIVDHKPLGEVQKPAQKPVQQPQRPVQQTQQPKPEPVSKEEIKSIRDAIREEIGKLPKNINKVIQEEVKNVTEERQKDSLFTPEEMSAPEDARQPAKTEDELYESAAGAQEEMMTILDRGQGLDKKLGLKHFDIAKGQMPDTDTPGPILVTAPLKGKKRAEEKVEADYGGDWSRLQDVVRATIAVDTFDQVKSVLGELRKSGVKMAKPPSDRFTHPTSVGYRDVKMNLQYSNGHIGELQVHVKAILKAKDQAHKEYETVRTIEAKAKVENRDTLTDDEQAEVDKANARMKQMYEEAWKGAMKTASARVAAKDTGKTEYYELSGNPVIVERKKFPVMYVKGKPKVLRDFFRVYHEGNSISKERFDKMVKESGKST